MGILTRFSLFHSTTMYVRLYESVEDLFTLDQATERYQTE